MFDTTVFLFLCVFPTMCARQRKKEQTSKEKTDLSQSCKYLPSELCNGPISFVATEEGTAKYGTAAVALRRKIGANLRQMEM